MEVAAWILVLSFIFYVGYFRGWSFWCLVPFSLAVTVSIIFLCLGIENSWVHRIVDLVLFWIPMTFMAVYGRNGRVAFIRHTKIAYDWIQNRRQ